MFKNRKEYLPYLGVALVVILIVQMALMVLMTKGLVPLSAGKKASSLAWLVVSGLTVAVYAWNCRPAFGLSLPKQAAQRSPEKEFFYSISS